MLINKVGKESNNNDREIIYIDSNNVQQHGVGNAQLTCGTRFLKLAMMLVLLNSW